MVVCLSLKPNLQSCNAVSGDDNLCATTSPRPSEVSTHVLSRNAANEGFWFFRSRERPKPLNCHKYSQQRGDPILVYKIIHGLEHGLKFEDMFQWHLSPYLHGHSTKLRSTIIRLNLRSEFFTQRVVGKWNDLTQSVLETKPLHLFKKRLDDNLCSRFFPQYSELN
nr:unnamed protein product [Spirometra erinaceieuropaei]